MKVTIIIFFGLFIGITFAAVPLPNVSNAAGDGSGSGGDAKPGDDAKPGGSNLPDLCSYVPISACKMLEQACKVENGKCSYKYKLPDIPRPSIPKLPAAGSSGNVPDLCLQIPMQLCSFALACKVEEGKCKARMKLPGQ